MRRLVLLLLACSCEKTASREPREHEPRERVLRETSHTKTLRLSLPALPAAVELTVPRLVTARTDLPEAYALHGGSLREGVLVNVILRPTESCGEPCTGVLARRDANAQTCTTPTGGTTSVRHSTPRGPICCIASWAIDRATSIADLSDDQRRAAESIAASCLELVMAG